MGRTIGSLEEIRRKCPIGSLSVGAAGGITALVGVILAPFTFGASLIVAGVGVGVGVADGVTSVASSITNTVQQNPRESLEKIQQDYKNVSEPIFNSLNTLRRELRKFRTFDKEQIPWKFDKTKLLCATEHMSLGVLANVGRIAAQSTKLARAAAAATGVLTELLVILGVFSIVNDAVDIHQMNQGKINNPEKVQSSVLKGIVEMRKTHTELCNALDGIKQIRKGLKCQG